MKRVCFLVGLVIAVGCGGDTDSGGSSGTGGASGGSGGATGGSGGATGGSGGTTGGSGGATGGVAGASGGAGGVAGGAGGALGGAAGSGNTGGGTGVPCNPGDVTCNGIPPNCPAGEVASVQGSCWGPCVPVLTCATVPSCDNCQGFCASYESFTTEYRCVMPTVQCAALACSCLGQYLCDDPFSACNDNPGNNPPISCICIAC